MPGIDVNEIDDVIHGRIRLGVMAYLADAEVADFTELKSALKATQGNLSVHLRKLEDAGYIAIDKSFLNRKPLTRARLTKSGRKALAAYLEAMSRLVSGLGDQKQRTKAPSTASTPLAASSKEGSAASAASATPRRQLRR